MPPHAELPTWTERMKHATFWRREVKRSFGDNISHLQVMDGLQIGGQRLGPVLVGLGSVPTADGSAPVQTVVYAPLEDEKAERLELRPLINTESFSSFDENKKLSPELTLFFERTRGHIWSGIMSYSVHHPSRRILMSTAGGMFVYRDGSLHPIADWNQNEPMNAAFSTFDSDYVAFCAKGQLYIDKNNQQVFTTASDASNSKVTNGLASFVVQEELERDEGFWWSPKRLELIYERVDERAVCELSFVVPGKQPQSPMRYPLCGTENASSYLHLVTFEEKSGKFVDRPLLTFFENILPEYSEYYIARAGWTDDGDSFYVMLMNRQQSRRAIVVIGKDAFTFASSEPRDLPIKVIYEEQSTIWINHNNATFFLPSTHDAVLRVIYASEKSDFCHLYMHQYSGPITETSHQEFAITKGAWPVIKDVTPTVDEKRQLIYFLANCSTPVRTMLCVASYKQGADQTHKSLTPSHLCYKFDRSEPHLHVNPDHGFACWLSNLRQLPECHFYGLVHHADQPLPDAQFRYRVRLQPCVMPPLQNGGESTGKLSAPPTDEPMSPAAATPDDAEPPMDPEKIFTHRFFEVKLQDGTTVNSLVLLPANRNSFEEKKLPVIHYVYGGPGLQVVRDSWITASQFLKFLSVGYAIFAADSRGSSNRGIHFERVIKNRMGSVEVDDQVFTLRAVAQMCPELDLERVAVTGWSYGGYMSLQMLAQHPDLYRCSCSAAAVVDWSLYDTCYTERYMGRPNEQADAYKASSVLSRISAFPDEEDRLLIIHGLIDDNVHFHHTEKLLNGLINAGKPHRLLIFPSERHGIRKAEAVEYLHASMLSFFDRSLKL